MAERNRDRDKRAYRRKMQRVVRDGSVCWICGDEIPKDVHYLDPMAGTSDHVVPLAKGGSAMGLCRPAHRRCNSKKGAGDRPPQRKTSQDW